MKRKPADLPVPDWAFWAAAGIVCALLLKKGESMTLIGKMEVSGKTERLLKTRKDRKGKIKYTILFNSSPMGFGVDQREVPKSLYDKISVGDKMSLYLDK